MADIVKTIGSTGDYADPILWAAGEGGAYTTDRAVGELLEDITMSSLFRPNQAFAGGGLLRGDKAVTGKIGDGWALSNTAGTRMCLAPSSNLDFEDIEWDLGSNTYTIQNSGNNTLTRCLMPNGFIYYTADKSLTLNNSLLAKVDGLVSTTQGNITLSNTTVTDRLIIRAETLLTILNSNSIANDWILGPGNYTNSETLVNYCYIKQNAPASDFGTGSSNNTINTDTTAEMVDYANGDYRIKSASTLATAGQGGTFIGAFLEASSGLTASITESGPSFTEQISTTLSKAIQASITELGPSFAESISANLSVNITGSIGESGPAFTESISATLSTLTIQGDITESGPSFTDSISIDVQASAGLNASIAELGPSFTESVQASLDKAIEANISEYGPSFTDSITISLTSEIDASIGEYGPSFIESLSAKIPVKISVNAKNTIKVKRSANTVKIKRKSNILRVK